MDRLSFILTYLCKIGAVGYINSFRIIWGLKAKSLFRVGLVASISPSDI